MAKVYTHEITDVYLTGSRLAQAMWVSSQVPKHEALRRYGFVEPHPVMVIIGGAGVLDRDLAKNPSLKTALQSFFQEVLAPLAQTQGLIVMDGGTKSGVISLMGESRVAIAAEFPLIGVVPQGKAQLPGQPSTGATSTHNLEPNHTHFFLIPGDQWGQESPWLADFATLIAAEQQPVLTVLMNGGPTSLVDLQANLAAGCLVVIVKGSGRLADQVGAAVAGESYEDVPLSGSQDAQTQAKTAQAIAELVETYGPQGRLVVVDLSTPALELFEQLKHYLERAL